MKARFQKVRAAGFALALLAVASARAAVPGITGTGAGSGSVSFQLDAAPAHISQPDGASVYSWGYGCQAGFTPGFVPAGIGASKGAHCGAMQIPGPTLVVTQGDLVSITLTNNLPAAAGPTSIVIPDFAVSSSDGTQGLLAHEAATGGGTVTYTFTATNAGTHVYYSGTQPDVQVEMGLFGAIIVLPKAADIPAVCTANVTPTGHAVVGSGGTLNDQARQANGEADFRLAKAGYAHSMACYDREYLAQLSEMDRDIHLAVEAQAAQPCANPLGCVNVATEPYRPTYFMVNGRSMPDNMDPEYAVQLPNQPYNGNPHMHPGEHMLLRVIGTGRTQHPLHEHAEHVRVLARDGHLLLGPDGTSLAGPLLFTTTTTPGQAIDGIFTYTAKGLNWDMFGHGYAGDTSVCVADANGFYTADPTAPNYFEWCGDHNKALEAKPYGNVGSGGPITLPDPNSLVTGPWYGGSPYFGPDATARAVGNTPINPAATVANSPSTEAGWAYMWHSHAERELTTNNIFPGGMLMMLLVDPRAFVIDESN